MKPFFMLILFTVAVVENVGGEAFDDCSEIPPAERAKNVTLYHYTNECGKDGIIKSGIINISSPVANVSDDDAYFGEGAYFTQKPPDTPLLDLLFNNFGNTDHKNAYKLDFFFNCSFSRMVPYLEHSKEACSYKKGSRNIWLYHIRVNITLFNCKNGTRNKSRRRRSADRLWSVCSGAKSMIPESVFLLAVTLASFWL